MATSSLERLLSLSCDAIGELRSVLMLIDRDEPHHLEARRALDMTRDWHEHLAEEDYGYLARHFPQPEPEGEPQYRCRECGATGGNDSQAFEFCDEHTIEEVQPEPEGGAEPTEAETAILRRICDNTEAAIEQGEFDKALGRMIVKELRAARAAGAREAEQEVGILKQMVASHEEDCACLPEDQTVTETVTALKKRAEALEGLLRGVREAVGWAVDSVPNAAKEKEWRGKLTRIDAALADAAAGAAYDSGSLARLDLPTADAAAAPVMDQRPGATMRRREE